MPKKCSVATCERPSDGLGYCKAHYARFRRTNDPLGSARPSVDARFARYVETSDGCWLWRGRRNNRGYGKFYADGKQKYAHRVAYELAHAVTLDATVDVCHTCDNPPCVRPEHLFLGDAKANGQDMARKSRAAFQQHPDSAPRGESNGHAKLTDAAVIEVIALSAKGVLQSQLAARFGVCADSISNVLHGRTWRHVTKVAR